MTQPLTDADARRLLDDAELIPALQLGIAEAKQIQAECLASGLPAILGKDDHCASGCAPKVLLLIRPDDADALRTLLARKWQAMLETVEVEGSRAPGLGVEVGEDAEPPCPACGHQGPLEDGACSECGLNLG
jgi:hypothetical protein